MVAGYSLGNKGSKDDILVVGEEDEDVITYSISFPSILTRKCRNKCPYCAFHREDTLVVPYSTISKFKMARAKGIRELLFISGERPDLSPAIRTTLDLWGFSSYVEYLYTVAELGFLEGLIPVFEIGSLAPLEFKRLSEICGLYKIMLDGVHPNSFSKVYPASPGKELQLRLNSIIWAGRVNLPVITGVLVGIGETKVYRKFQLQQISKLHAEFGHIHEVNIHPFFPQPGTPFEKRKIPSHKALLDTFEMARSILPDDVLITVPVHFLDSIDDFVKAGLRDLGSIPDSILPSVPHGPYQSFETISANVEKLGFRLQQRFPLKFSFIKQGLYAPKLGQVFDAYKYKIKKAELEKLKEIKQNQLK